MFEHDTLKVKTRTGYFNKCFKGFDIFQDNCVQCVVVLILPCYNIVILLLAAPTQEATKLFTKSSGKFKLASDYSNQKAAA